MNTTKAYWGSVFALVAEKTDCETEHLLEYVNEELAVPGTYYPVVNDVVSLIVIARGVRNVGNVEVAEKLEQQLFDLMCSGVDPYVELFSLFFLLPLRWFRNLVDSSYADAGS